ncbi:MAG TPA: hypothetical protein VFT20_02120 [Candidatus Limnocylindrales bacterium]|nr:hypothetical protein [Candidatus Limnocylindrales bacterium]
MRAPRRLAVLAAVTLLIVACGGSATPEPAAPTDAPTSTLAASPPPATGSPTVPPFEPSASPPNATPATASPVAPPTADVESQVPGSADACTGDDANREFFVAAANALDWTVYCAILPSGWFVDAGEYRQAGGGRLEISYRGPSGARLGLRQGAFCSDASGCVPDGSDAGEAVFGDMNGALVALDDGGWAVVVDRGAPISWLAVVSGTDEAAARAIVEGLIPVDA